MDGLYRWRIAGAYLACRDSGSAEAITASVLENSGVVEGAIAAESAAGGATAGPNSVTMDNGLSRIVSVIDTGNDSATATATATANGSGSGSGRGGGLGDRSGNCGCSFSCSFSGSESGNGSCSESDLRAATTTVVQEQGALPCIQKSRARCKKWRCPGPGRSSISGRGFTLLEMLICLSLLTLLSTFTLSSVRESGQSSEPSRFTTSLSRLLITARSLAVASGERITLCGSSDGVSCSRDWHESIDILVFSDRDGDRRLGQADALHVQQRLLLRHANAYWRGSGGRPYLRYRVDGSAIDYGRFSYCPHSGDSQRFRQLVVNRVGRAYLQRDSLSKSLICP